MTQVPAGQSAVCDGVELTDHSWLRPSVALADYETGKIGMVLPQIMTLEELSRFKMVEEAIVSARERHVPTILTKIKFSSTAGMWKSCPTEVFLKTVRRFTLSLTIRSNLGKGRVKIFHFLYARLSMDCPYLEVVN